MIKIVHTASWLHYPNRNVFSDNRKIYCTTSPPLSGAMDVRFQRLQMLHRRRYCISALQRMFGSLWNVVGTDLHSTLEPPMH